jgi:hypothetical protein
LGGSVLRGGVDDFRAGDGFFFFGDDSFFSVLGDGGDALFFFFLRGGVLGVVVVVLLLELETTDSGVTGTASPLIFLLDRPVFGASGVDGEAFRLLLLLLLEGRSSSASAAAAALLPDRDCSNRTP